MPLDQQQQLAYDRRIQQMKEDGFFLPSARSLSGNTRHLIISFGGTGADALFGVKKIFETVLPRQQLNERVRFLAIDTDTKTQKKTKDVVKQDGSRQSVEVDSLTNSQFFQLTGSLARNIVEHPNLDRNVAQWINPQVVQMVRSKQEYLNGNGASGVRQIGRLTLYPAGTVSSLRSRIAALVGELTNDNKYQLRVFILTGISGGTGSGTVVDLSYLIRDSIPTHLAHRTRYCGFVLLPSTGESSDPVEIDHGNYNGYAALKEINHFMTLTQRHETYSFTYGDGKTVSSEEPIFNTCYLLDGYAGEMGFASPRKQAVKVLSESLLDMVTSSQTTGEDTIQTVDSFMNDAATFAIAMVAQQSVSNAPRDADYIYNALGHNEFAVPANEIKAYVGKQLFDEIYSQFGKCEDVGDNDIRNFVERVIKRGVATKQAVKKAMDKEIEAVFTDRTYGPFYTINLLAAVDSEISSLKSKMKLFRPGMVSDESLDWIDSYAIKCNNETFSAYTYAMEGLRTLMESQFKAVVKTEKGEKFYSFMPQNLGATEDAKYIITYLDGLINSANLKTLTNDLLQEMIDNRENWVALVQNEVAAKNDPAAAMRRFWNEKLDAMVNATMEDFLIKYYSGNPDAHYSPENPAITEPYLSQAAQAIYEQMLGAGGSAEPLVRITGKGLTAENLNCHTFLMVPSCAPHLYQALADYARIKDSQVRVCQSLSVDRISCYKQYSGIPAFKMEWTLTAEKAYEGILNTDAGYGLHMSETAGGKLWKNFPNLLPRSSWKLLNNPGEPYSNPREAILADKAEHQFEEALQLGIAASNILVGVNQIYHVKILPAAFRPAESLYKNLDHSIPGSNFEKEQLKAIAEAAEKCAVALFTRVANWETADQLVTDLAGAEVAFEERVLRFPGTVISKTDADDIPNWDEKVASYMLRKLPETMSDLDGTLQVMKLLEAKVRRSVRARTLIKRFAQYLAVEMFHFDEAEQEWKYLDANEVPQELVYLESNMEAAAEYYFMFNAFRNDPETIAQAVQEKFAEFIPTPTDRGSRTAKRKVFQDGGENLKAEVLTWLRSHPMKPFASVAKLKGYNVAEIENFYKALYQEAIEIATVGYIPVDIGEEKSEEDFELPVGGLF